MSLFKMVMLLTQLGSMLLTQLGSQTSLVNKVDESVPENISGFK